MPTFETIIYATDFSESSDQAFDYALSLATKFNSRLIILHVINEPIDLRGFYVPHISFEKLEGEIKAGAEKMMQDFLARNLKDFSQYETLILPGIPYKEIINQATEKKADLVVTGTHGRTGLDHVLFGSTAEKVVRLCPVPVLTTRTTEG